MLFINVGLWYGVYVARNWLDAYNRKGGGRTSTETGNGTQRPDIPWPVKFDQQYSEVWTFTQTTDNNLTNRDKIRFFLSNSHDFPETEELYKEDGGKWNEDRDVKESDDNRYDYLGLDDEPLDPLGADYLEEDNWDWDEGN